MSKITEHKCNSIPISRLYLVVVNEKYGSRIEMEARKKLPLIPGKDTNIEKTAEQIKEMFISACQGKNENVDVKIDCLIAARFYELLRKSGFKNLNFGFLRGTICYMNYRGEYIEVNGFANKKIPRDKIVEMEVLSNYCSRDEYIFKAFPKKPDEFKKQTGLDYSKNKAFAQGIYFDSRIEILKEFEAKYIK